MLQKKNCEIVSIRRVQGGQACVVDLRVTAGRRCRKFYIRFDCLKKKIFLFLATH